MKKAFTLIEILVTIGVLGVLMTSVVGVMTMSFKAKNMTESNRILSSKATFVLDEVRNNILNAQMGTINCPTSSAVGNSISFETKDGGYTTLLCDGVGGQVASVSAEGTYNFLESGVKAINCNNFMWCNMSSGSEIESIGVSLNLQVDGSSGVGATGLFWETVTPRE